MNKLSKKLCTRPWDYVEIASDGSVWTCCSSWLPLSLGNILNEEFDAILNSDSSRRIRNSIIDGSFRYCDKTKCQLIASNKLWDRSNEDQVRYLHVDYASDRILDSPFFYNLCYDESCNLSCPGCRKEVFQLSQNQSSDKRFMIHDKVMDHLFNRPTARYRRINISGSGDPFASLLYMSMLKTVPWRLFPHTVIDFQTNGLLLNQHMWEILKGLGVRTGTVAVSVDAATSATYNLVRRGGSFEILMNNLRLIDLLRGKNDISYLRVDFVVQKHNYQEIPEFIALMKSFPSVDRISFSLIDDWGSYAPGDFDRQAIWKTNHPEHKHFLNVLRDSCFEDSRVFLGNLSPYRKFILGL